MKINLHQAIEIEDLLTDKKTQEETYDEYLEVIDEVEEKGNKDEIKKLYEEMDMTLERMEINNLAYRKLVKSCDHIKINFGGGYQKCLICECENEKYLNKIFGNEKMHNIYVETYMKKYGKIFQNAARDNAFYDIKDMYFELLSKYEENEQEATEEKLIYDLAVKTHGYTQKIKKIGSRKIS